MHRLVLPLSFLLAIMIHSIVYLKIMPRYSYSDRTTKISIVVNSKAALEEKPLSPISQKKRVFKEKSSSNEKIQPLKNISSKAYSQYKISPKYSYLSRVNQEEGKTIVQAYIDKSGSLKSLKMIKSSGYKRLDDEAIRSIKEATFIAAKNNNIPIDDKIEITINFNLVD